MFLLLIVKSHDSSTDTDPEEVNNRLKAYGLDPGSNMKQKQKIKLKKRKERTNSRTTKRLKSKELKTEKENTSNEANRKNKLLIKDFSTKTAQQRKEKVKNNIALFSLLFAFRCIKKNSISISWLTHRNHSCIVSLPVIFCHLLKQSYTYESLLRHLSACASTKLHVLACSSR